MRADYILRYRADYPIAVVEAKAAYKSAAKVRIGEFFGRGAGVVEDVEVQLP